jgi:hemerythrin-like domain-containing protein
MPDMDSQKDAFQLLLEEHTKLRGLLNDLREMVQQQSGSIQEVAGMIQQLHDQVDVHFQAEEASDCFPDLVNAAPRVSDRVVILLAEHGELRAEIHQLVQDARRRSGTTDDWDQLARLLQDFTGKLLTHERTEDELVQEVFTDDIGSKD